MIDMKNITSQKLLMTFIAFALVLSSAYAISCNYISGGNYTTLIPAFNTSIPVKWETLVWDFDVVANPTASDCASVGGTCKAACLLGEGPVLKLSTQCLNNKICCAFLATSAQLSISTDLGSTWSSIFKPNLVTSNTYSITGVSPNPSSNISMMAQLITDSALLSPRLKSITLYSGPRLAASQGNTMEKCWPVSVEHTCGASGTKYYDGTPLAVGSIVSCDDNSLYLNQTIVIAKLNSTTYTENNYTDNSYGATNKGICSS